MPACTLLLLETQLSPTADDRIEADELTDLIQQYAGPFARVSFFYENGVRHMALTIGNETARTLMPVGATQVDKWFELGRLAGEIRLDMAKGNE